MSPVDNPPRANVTQVFAAWLDGKSKTIGPVSSNGRTIYSYSMPIALRAPTGHVFVVEKKKGAYTNTTAQHVSGLHELVKPHGELDVAYVSADELRQADRTDEAAEDLVVKHFDTQHYPQKNPHRDARGRDFEENPPWVTKMIAGAMVTLQEQIPPKWLPKFEATVAGQGNIIRAELAEYGCGAYGCVMPTLDKDVVLKLSSDPSEAEFAATIADTLPTPCVVRYHSIVKLEGQERHGREVYLLWRESATDVGDIHKIVGMHAEKAIRKQHRAAVDAYIAVAGGDLDAYGELMEIWKRRCMEMAKIPELEFAAIGMLRAWNEQGVFISDTHGGNLGICLRNGKPTWVITDPGNVVVSTEFADERGRGRGYYAPAPGLRTPREPKRKQKNPGTHTVQFHRELQRGPIDEWKKLEYVGRQLSWDDDDNEMYLDVRNCTCGSTLSRPEAEVLEADGLTENPIVPRRGAQAFFERVAGWATPPGMRRDEARRRSARELAIAEYVLEYEHPDAEVLWEEEGDIYSLRKEAEREGYEFDDAFVAVLAEDGETLASLGGIMDPDREYQRLIEAELAYEAWPERVAELAVQLHERRGRPLRVNPIEINPEHCARVMRAVVEVGGRHGGLTNPFTAQEIADRVPTTMKSQLADTERYLNYFVTKELLERRGQKGVAGTNEWFALTQKALDYHDQDIARWPDVKTLVRREEATPPAFGTFLSSAELARYIKSFIGEAWTVTPSQPHLYFERWRVWRLEITSDASEFAIAIEAIGRRDTAWPSIEVRVVANVYPYTAPTIPAGDNISGRSFPHSPQEFVAMILPFTDAYHP